MSLHFGKISIAITLLFSSLFFFSAVHAQVNLSSGLIGYYPFTGNANDASGNNINGTVSGAVLTTDRNGNPGNAYQFDGTTSYIQLPFSSLYDFAPSGTFSISLWVQPAAGSQSTATAGLVVKAPSAANYTQAAWNYGSYMLSNKFMTGYSNTNFLVSNTTMSNSQCWYNLVFTYNNAQWHMYVNGVLENSDLSGNYSILQDHSSSIVFGKKGMANGDYYKGKMDEVRIYNRELNAAEANALYYDGSTACPDISVGSCNNWLNTTGGYSSMTIGDLDVSGSTITVEALFNETTLDANADVVSKHLDPTDDNYLLRTNYAAITTTNGSFQTDLVCDVVANKTYHVAMTYDGSTLKFYRNGYLMSSKPCTGTMINNNYLTMIGNYAGNPGANAEPLIGYINEVRIWNVARTQAEIQTYMNASIPNPTAQSALLAYYTFDNTVNKQGNTTWNGTLNNGATVSNTNPTCSSFVADSCTTIQCNNWLNTTGGFSSLTIGDLDVSGNIITVEGLFNETAIDANADVVSKHLNPTDDNYLLRTNLAAVTTSNGFFQTDPVCDIVANKTYHVAMTYDGSTLKFYRNGYLMSSKPCTGNLVNNNYLTMIGNYAGNSGANAEPLIGYINEVRIWNVARTQAQIQTYMNNSLPNPTTQSGLLAYYTYNNTVNQQGNTLWNGTLNSGATINNTNPACTLVVDSCGVIPVPPVVVTAGFSIPDTVCVNSPVTITNTSTGANTNYWNFCTANANSTPTGTQMGNIGGTFQIPVFMDYAEYNGNYYGFMVNNDAPGGIVRLNFGNSLANTPTATNLGNIGGVLPRSLQGIQLVNTNGKWYAIIVGGDPTGPAVPSRIIKLDFGTSLTNTPVGTNWGNIGMLNYPTDLVVFNEANNWYGLTVNYLDNTVTRFSFGTDFTNPPTGVNLGNIGNLNGPSGICSINDNGTWRVFVANYGSNSLSRIDFGNSLLNTPTASVNLGTLGSQLNTPRDLYIFKYCDQTVGFLVNDVTGNMVRLNFNSLTTAPSAVSLGNLGGAVATGVHSISRVSRIGADLFAFLPNSSSNSVSKLDFSGCTNSSIPNSSLQSPPSVSYNTPGTYNINLTLDDGLPTQTSLCKAVVVTACNVAPAIANFTIPDTVCVNTPVNITNTSTGASTYYWNFCTANVNSAPTGTLLGNVGNSFALPVFMDYGYQNGNYYAFMTNNYPGGIVRLDFGASLTNTPTATNLGKIGGTIPDYLQGIQLVNNNGHWYAIIVGGDPHGSVPSRIMKLDFGTSLTNTPVVTDWGNIGSLNYPHDIFVFQEGVNWYGLTVNYYDNTVTRFTFGTDFINPPTGTNLGALGNMNEPSGICPINDNGTWRVFVANYGNNTLSRIDFGNSLLNTPTTSVNLGNIGGQFSAPRDLYIFKYCDQTVGFVVNETTGNVVRLNFNSLSTTPTATSLGALGGASGTHSISKVFRVNADVFAFLPNTYTNSLSRLQFAGCTNSSIPNSSLQTPPSVTYNTPGTYNINLTLDDGLPTQASLCKAVVVVNKPSVDFNFQQDGCNPLTVRFQGDTTNASSLAWSFGNGATATNTKDTITYGSYGNYTVKLTASASTGCTDSVTKTISVNVIQDSAIITHDTMLCKGDTLILKAVPGFNYCWTSSVAAVVNNTSQSPSVYPDTTTTYYLNSLQQGANLIVNGDFSQGNIGFTSAYGYAARNTVEGQYYVGTDPVAWNPGAYVCRDHTTGSGNMMMVNGSPTPNAIVWSQTINTIQPNTNYVFSAWIESLDPINPAALQFSINGQTVGNVFNASATSCLWQQFYTTWNSGNNTTAVISLINKNTIAAGNDFDLDDLFFGGATIKQDSVKITILPPPNISITPDTSVCMGDSIQLFASGANTYLWTGSNNSIVGNPTSSNPWVLPSDTTIYMVQASNGVCQIRDSVTVAVMRKPSAVFSFQQDVCNPLLVQFQGDTTHLTTLTWDFGNGSTSNIFNPIATYSSYGNYPVKLTARSSFGCTDSITRTVGVTIVRDSAIVTRDTTLCKGDSIVLNAVTGLNYCWTSSVAALVNSSIQSPVAKPDTTTTYYLNSLQQGANLIVNSDFSQGNTGFTSQYLYSTSGVPAGVYTVGTDPVIWWGSGTDHCTDHTTGTGNMLMLNGASQANTKVWTETVTILPNTNYAFSTWVESLSPTFPAQLQFSINGTTIGKIFTADTISCRWHQFYTTWNSGNTTTAVISIVNQNTVPGGNDFALDDIFFGGVIVKQDSVTITIASPPIVSITPDTSVCVGDSIQLIASGASTYLWTGSNNTIIRDSTLFNPWVLPSDTTTYTLIAGNGFCSIKKTVTVAVKSKPDVEFSFQQDVCNPLSIQLENGSINIASSAWDLGNGSTSNAPNPLVTYSSYGSYPVKLVATAPTGCKDSISKLVAVTINHDSIIITNDTAICKGASLTLNAFPGLNFCWTSSTRSLTNSSTQSPLVTPDTTTTYFVNTLQQASNLIVNSDFSQGNTGFTSDYSFSASGIPEGVYTVGTNPRTWNGGMSACGGHTTGTDNMLIVNGSPQPDSKVWSETVTVQPNTNYAFAVWIQTVTATNPAALQFSINGVRIGSVFNANAVSCKWDRFYDIWNSGSDTTAIISIINQNLVPNGNDFALDDLFFGAVNMKQDSVKVSIIPPPIITVTPDTSVCIGDTIRLAANGADSYNWTAPNGNIQDPTIATIPVSPTITTTYHVMGTTGICSALDSVKVTVLNKPDLTLLFKDSSICVSRSVTLGASSTSTVQYQWTPVAGLNSSSISTPVASPASSVIYTIKITDTHGCTNKDSVNLTVFAVPAVMVRPDTSFCDGDSVRLTITTTDATKFQWQPSTGLSDATVAIPSASPSSTSSYTVTVSNPGGCTASGSATLSVLPLPVVMVSNDTLICLTGTAQLSATGGINYNWSPASGLSDNQIPSPTASPLATTRYSVKVTDNNGCNATKSVQISVNPQPIFAVQPNAISACYKDSVTITASGGDIYQWLSQNGVANPNAPQSRVSPGATITYPIKIINNECKVTDTVYATVTVKPLPDVVVTKSNDLDCFTGAATLTASGGIDYHWYPATGLSNPDIADPVARITQATTFYVDVTSANGCEKTDSVDVLVNIGGASNQYLMPNAFTPNNDGLNDCFGVPKNWGYILSLNFSVYNRFGQRVFHTNDPTQCWNGMYNGEPQQTGTFVYYVRAITICGSFERKGTVVLIK